MEKKIEVKREEQRSKFEEIMRDAYIAHLAKVEKSFERSRVQKYSDWIFAISGTAIALYMIIAAANVLINK